MSLQMSLVKSCGEHVCDGMGQEGHVLMVITATARM